MAAILGGSLAAGGGLLSGLGGAFGAGAQNRAARQARDQYAARTQEGMNRLGMAFFGPSNFMDYLSGTAVDSGSGRLYPASLEGALAGGQKPGDISEQEWQRLQGLYGDWNRMRGFVDRTGGPVLNQLQGFGADAQGLYDKAIGGFDADTNRLSALGRSMLGERDRAASAVTDLARGNVGIAREWGRGRESQIRRDSAKYRDDLNDQSSALLASRGFGGTMEANQLAANSRSAQEMQDDALTRLGEGVTDRRMAAQGALAGTQASLLGGRDAIQQAMLGNEYARSGQRTAYDIGNANSQMGYRMMPAQSILSVMQGSVMNPWLNHNTSQYYPGASPIGTAAQGVGNAAAGLGSAMLGQEWMKQLLKQN